MSKMANLQQLQEEEYLFRHRTSSEADRLNLQSSVIALLRNQESLEPFILSPSIRRVADVATGTGIWLEEISRGQLKGQDVEYVGFDISSSLFPKTPQPGMTFVKANVHTSFPEEYLGTFDIVHVRLVCLVVQVHEFENVVSNLMALLKPGGWLQWDEYCFVRGAAATYVRDIQPMGEMILDYMATTNYSLNTTSDIVAALNKQNPPVSRIGIRDYYEDCFEGMELQKALVEYTGVSSGAVVGFVSLKKGYDEKEAEGRVEAFQKNVMVMGEKGVVFPVPLVSITAQKSLRNKKT